MVEWFLSVAIQYYVIHIFKLKTAFAISKQNKKNHFNWIELLGFSKIKDIMLVKDRKFAWILPCKINDKHIAIFYYYLYATVT